MKIAVTVFFVLGFAVGANARDAGPTPDDIAAIPNEELRRSLFVVRDRALLINLTRAQTPADWLKIPGVKGAWKKSPAFRGKTVLHDVDGDGELELLGESPGPSEGVSAFWCRGADGAVRWETTVRQTSIDNNGVHCRDLDGDGSLEVVILGNYLQVLDARTGRKKFERFVFADLHGGPADKLTGREYRFEYPYRLARFGDRKSHHIVMADGYSPTHQWSHKGSDGKTPAPPQGGVQILALKPNGEPAWHFKHAGKLYRGGAHELRVHDLDGDGIDEVIYAANGGTICLNANGTQRWRFDAPPPAEHSDWIPIADVTGDGKTDVIVQHGGPGGLIYVLDGLSGKIHFKIPNRPHSQVQNLAAGRFRPELPGRQIALTTISGCMLRLIDGTTGKYIEWKVGQAEWPTLRRWNYLDMYNCAAHDTDGDGADEIFTFTTPKGGQLRAVGKDDLPTDPLKALSIGVAAFKGDGTLLQYWNFYTPTEQGIQWGVRNWDMRQFESPDRRFDVDRNGREEAFLETEPWILLVEVASLPRTFAVQK